MTIKMMTVHDLKPGAVLANEVVSENGKVLLGKNVRLTRRHIHLLTTWKIHVVSVNNVQKIEKDAASDGEATVSALAPQATVVYEYEHFVEHFNTLVAGVSQSFKVICTQNMIPINYLKGTAGRINTSIQQDGLAHFNNLLIGVRQSADFISHHSLMVAFLAGNIARRLGWSEQDISSVALAGLLHDIGMLPDGKKNQSRTHIAQAASMLRGVSGVSGNVILGVVQHRECMDGSGFPTAVTGNKIHPYAKVVAIADMFHSQAYGADFANPFPVLDSMNSELMGELDIAITYAFVQQVKDSLLNNSVLLSDGRPAKIIYFHPSGPALPVVKTDDGEIIDLAWQDNYAIRRMITPQ